MIKKSLILTFGLILFIGFILVLPLAFGFGKTGKETTILSHDYSFLGKKDIVSRLDQDFPLPQSITLTYDSRQFQLSLASISASVNRSKTADNLLFRRLNQGVGKYIRAFFSPHQFDLEINYDPQALGNYLEGVASQIDKPYIPSELVLDSHQMPQLKNGQIGVKTNTATLYDTILAALVNYRLDQSISIPVSNVGQLPNQSEIDQAMTNANKIVTKSLNLTSDYQQITIDDKTLVSWIGFDSTCRTDKIDDYVRSLAPSLTQPPVDAVFKFENNKVTDFQPSRPGYSLDIDRLRSAICPQMTQIISSPDSSSSIPIPLSLVDPKVKTSDVNDLGIKELIGHGFSSFKHSSTIRNYNVEKGSSIVNRILVAPGDTFSFIKSLGPVSLDNGFKQAYVIKKGQTVLDVGGGICQVSTTLFRALLNAGLNITSRQNHAYRVSYYEEDSKPGFDATVFIPSPDLKFVNDTAHYVLIQSTYDGKNKTLAYDIYGTSDGRKAEITNYRQWDAAPPPPAVYIDDPTLPAGKTVQDEHAIPGLKTSFDWKVTRNGEVIHQKTFQSIYVPWAAVYRRGPAI